MKTLTAAGFAVALPFAAQAESGVLGLDHMALTVPEMAQARAFFEDGLGCVHALDLGPFRDDAGTWMQDAIGTHARAVMSIAVMTCGNASNVELMEIFSPSQDTKFPTRDDHGASSLGFYTNDLEATLARAVAEGATPLSGITSAGEGPLAGRSFIYVTAPWGQQIFLMNDGNGIAFGKDPANVKVFSPADLPAR
jgi:catechol 2,3-dioxygenase-like lactoylglutathione lyase family enzyme